MTSNTNDNDHAARLAAIMDSSDEAIITTDRDGVVTAWNGAAEKLFGYASGDAIGQPIADLIVPPDRLDEDRDIAARIGRGESIERLPTVRRTRDGHRLFIAVTLSPIRDGRGRVTGTAQLARDVTEQRRADEVRARLAAIVESSADAVISKDLDGVIQSWNPGAEKLFGYSAAEAVGRHITMIVPPERRAEEEEVLAHVRRGEKVDHFETVRIAKDGRRIEISLTVSPVRNAAGDIIGASKIARDISAQRRAAAERADLLAREQAAREEAEALNRSKDQFLAILSHEMRTPLNAIFGWARIIHDERLDPALRARGAEVILRNARAQLRLVEDLLDMSRIITGAMRLDLSVVELDGVVASAVDSVRPAATAKDLWLELRLEADGVTVLGAPDRLQQVVWNLVMNAVKFTPAGGRVEVTVRKRDGYADVVVRDTGEGIAADVLPYVFDRFRQADSTTTRTHGGLGIGLALVRHLVDLHGGTVQAESDGPGRGAAFTVTLPLARSAAGERPVLEAGTVAVPSAAPLRDVRVLVVDDDVDSLDLARVVLSSVGADVRTRTSAADATDVLRDWAADVFVFDIEMPGEDGSALLRRIRASESAHGRRTPAIALTAYGGALDRQRAFEAGFDVHLVKPAEPRELTMAIASLAGRQFA
jgi:PAS domain S-box-containing protein